MKILCLSTHNSRLAAFIISYNGDLSITYITNPNKPFVNILYDNLSEANRWRENYLTTGSLNNNCDSCPHKFLCYTQRIDVKQEQVNFGH